MKELSEKKRLEIIVLFLKGLAYDEIAVKAGVAKGTVANVVSDFKEGRFPDFSEVADQVEGLRSLGVELKKNGAEVSQALFGATILSKLIEIGVTPQDIAGFADVWKKMSPPGEPIQEFTASALELFKISQATGESYISLAAKCSQVQTDYGNLQQEVRGLKSAKEELGTERDNLAKDVSKLTKEKHSLETDTSRLSARYNELQESAGKLEVRQKSLESEVEKLSKSAGTLRPEVEALKKLGFGKTELETLKLKLKKMASGQDMKSEEFTEKFFNELDEYGGILDLEQKKDKLERKVAMLEEGAESLEKVTARLGLPLDLVEEAVKGLASLKRRGIGLDTVVSFHRILSQTEMGPGDLERQALELGGLKKKIEDEKQAMKQLETERNKLSHVVDSLRDEAIAIRAATQELIESGRDVITNTRDKALTAVRQATDNMAKDIKDWGSARAELGAYLDDLKRARYFTKLPLSKDALDSYVQDISPAAVSEYLEIALLWCTKNCNVKLTPPNWIIEKYYTIDKYKDVELRDLLRWSLEWTAGGIKA